MAFSYSESEADFVKKVKSDLTGFVEISSLSRQVALNRFVDVFIERSSR